jgi:sarcosine oxidase delta subunit
MSQHEAISRGAERTFIRQQMLSDITIRPTLKHSLSDKTHKTRIIEYYCKALHSLLNVPDGAELVQILNYGDAQIVREHREPHKTLKAWTDYESLSGTNKVEQWLKQKGVLHPASDERSAIANELRKRVETQAKKGKQAAEKARRAQEKKAKQKR